MLPGTEIFKLGMTKVKGDASDADCRSSCGLVLDHIIGAVTNDQCYFHAGFAARLVSFAALAEIAGNTYQAQVCNRLGSHTS